MQTVRVEPGDPLPRSSPVHQTSLCRRTSLVGVVTETETSGARRRVKPSPADIAAKATAVVSGRRGARAHVQWPCSPLHSERADRSCLLVQPRRQAAVTIALTAVERAELEGLAGRRRTAQGLARRARIVLAAADGLENKAIAQVRRG
jgi:hypothetical protein